MSLWTTRANELVGIGDMVALSVVEHSDAVGRVVAATADGGVQCVLVRCFRCEPGTHVTVTEQQLLARVYG